MILRFNAFATRGAVFSRTWRSYTTKQMPMKPPKKLPANTLNNSYVYAVENKKPKQVYPERLLIYDASALATATVAFSKLAIIFIFGTTCVYVAPKLYADPSQPNWIAWLAIAIAGGVLVGHSMATAPYVAQIHIRIPPPARMSKEALMKFLKTGAVQKLAVDFTTVRLNGLQKTTSATLGQLQPLRPRLLRIANIGRPTEHITAKRTWYAGLTYWLREPRNQFYVRKTESGMRRSRAPGAWQIALSHIQQRPFLE